MTKTTGRENALAKPVVHTQTHTENTSHALLLHIPHSSTYLPPHFYPIYLNPQQLPELTAATADLYTDELFIYPAPRLVFPVSRLLCDVERFRDPDLESMSRLGMWVCYTHDMQGRPLARFDESHVQKVLTTYYDVHHARLTRLTQQLLTASGQVLILDCHSFPPALPYYPPGPCPDICLGADSYHTPAYLIETARSFLERRGYKIAVNHPFSGSLVPLAYYQKERRVRSLMLEVNRRSYCDEKNRKLPLFGQLQQDLQELMKMLALGEY